jgi:hypothetical protein
MQTVQYRPHAKKNRPAGHRKVFKYKMMHVDKSGCAAWKSAAATCNAGSAAQLCAEMLLGAHEQ